MAPLVSGFTICRNSVKLGFPFLESIRSLAPLCDEIVVAVDDTGDGTLAALEELALSFSKENVKVVLVSSVWDLENMKGGEELARQTNIALKSCRHELVFYLQSDECLHERDYPNLRSALEQLESDPAVASLSLGWVHFYGDPFSFVESRKWYRREIRAFKKSSGLQSYKDAQSFRKKTESGWEKLPTLLCAATVYHYGHVRPRELMALKVNDLHRQWNGDAHLELRSAESVFKPQYGIKPFTGEHSSWMQNYLAALPSQTVKAYEILKPRPAQLKHFRYWVSDLIEKFTGHRPGEFKSYSKLVRSRKNL